MTFKPYPNTRLVKGVITTNNTWDRPDHGKFNEWIKVVSTYIRINEIPIEMYVCGKFIENPSQTWDIDVILTHPKIRTFTDTQLIKIRDFMIYGMQTGFDRFNMLIDMACYLPYDTNGNFWYSSEDYQKYGRIRTQVLYVFDKIYQDGVVIQDFNMKHETMVKKVCESLFLVTKLSPSQKHIDRITNGSMYAQPQRIL